MIKHHQNLMLNLALVGIILNWIKCDDCLVKLDANTGGYGRFWQLCFDSLALNDSSYKCKNDQMKLSTENENPNYSLTSLFNDLKPKNQAYSQSIEIGNVYNETLSLELAYQMTLFSGLERNIGKVSFNLFSLESNYFNRFIRNNSNETIKKNLQKYNSSNTEEIFVLISEVQIEIAKLKRDQSQTFQDIISNVNKDKTDWSERIRISDSSQKAQYISNYNNVLINRLKDVNNQVLNVKNRLISIENYLESKRKYLIAQSENRLTSLGLSSVLRDHSTLSSYMNEFYSGSLKQTRYVMDQTELLNCFFKVRLTKVSSSLQASFGM
jgi:hypothetical protein